MPPRLAGSDEAEVAAAKQLIELSRAGKVIVPLSVAHVVETAKAGGRRRVDLARTMVEVSRGWQMHSPLTVRAFELDSMFSRRDMSVGSSSGVFSLDPEALWSDAPKKKPRQAASGLPAEMQGLTDRITWLAALFETLLERDSSFPKQGHELASRWATHHHELAVHMRSNPKARPYARGLSRMRFIVDIQRDLATAASRNGLAPEDFSTWLQDDAEKALSQCPYLGRVREVLHLRLTNADDKWEPNDLNDIMFLACAGGYADVVVAERKFGNYLHRVSPKVPVGAAIFRRLRDALPVIEGLV